MRYYFLGIIVVICVAIELFLYTESKADINSEVKEFIVICENNDKLGDITRDKILAIKGIGKVKVREIEKSMKYRDNWTRKDIYAIALVVNRAIFVFTLVYIIKQYFVNTRMISTIIQIFKRR